MIKIDKLSTSKLHLTIQKCITNKIDANLRIKNLGSFFFNVQQMVIYFVIMCIFHHYIIHICCNPTLAKCGGEAQHSQSWGLGVLQDSRMFRVQHQGPKLLALRRSWRH
jgi:hypothetical protein